jgi:hypothetical protein
VFGTIDRFLDMHETALELAALLTIVLAVIRRNRTVLVLAGIMVAWVILEIAFALHGWPGLQRYMYEAGGLMVVLAAVGIGWLIPDARTWPALKTLSGRSGVLAAAGSVVALVVVLGLVPAAVSRVRTEHRDLQIERRRTTAIDQLGTIVARLGGPSLLTHCGEPLVSLQFQSALAWTLHVNVAKVGWKFERAIAATRPIIIYDSHHGAWRILALRQHYPGCPHYASYTRLS